MYPSDTVVAITRSLATYGWRRVPGGDDIAERIDHSRQADHTLPICTWKIVEIRDETLALVAGQGRGRCSLSVELTHVAPMSADDPFGDRTANVPLTVRTAILSVESALIGVGGWQISLTAGLPGASTDEYTVGWSGVISFTYEHVAIPPARLDRIARDEEQYEL